MSICLQQNRKMLRSQPSLSTCLPNFLPKGLCADGIRAHCTVTIWITVARMIHCPIYEVICHFTSATDKILPKIINSQRFDKSCGGESYFSRISLLPDHSAVTHIASQLLFTCIYIISRVFHSSKNSHSVEIAILIIFFQPFSTSTSTFRVCFVVVHCTRVVVRFLTWGSILITMRHHTIRLHFPVVYSHLLSLNKMLIFCSDFNFAI